MKAKNEEGGAVPVRTVVPGPARPFYRERPDRTYRL